MNNDEHTHVWKKAKNEWGVHMKLYSPPLIGLFTVWHISRSLWAIQARSEFLTA